MCIRIYILAIAAFMAMRVDAVQAQTVSPVSTDAGLMQGLPPDARGVTAFKGIPYAAPPVGVLRWRPPQPALPWAGTRDAAAFGPACWAAALPGLAPAAGPPQSEDCLTLNVWTNAVAPGPDKSAAKPVMVWVHGGGFAFGSSAMPAYDGSRLAARDVVVVSVNYRLGVFGFLAHPALDGEGGGSGAYGLQDQVAALRWVQRNIAAFGGDPGNVTLFGESAGAHSVGLLMASPQAKGLFAKATAQSGAFWDSEHGSIPTHAEALENGRMLNGRLQAPTLADLRAIPAQSLNQLTAWDFKADPSVKAFGPSIDGHVLTESPAAVFNRGAQPKIPLLGGWNAAEFSLFQSRAFPHATAEEFDAAAGLWFGNGNLAAFRKAYPAQTPEQARASAYDLIGDLVISEQTWEMLGLHQRKSGSKVYAYQFSYASPYSPVPAHVADVPFVFGTLTPQYFAPKAPQPEEGDRAMSDLMMSYWTNFAKQGDPNGPGLPLWPAYGGPSSTVMHLRTGAASGPETGSDRLRFIASFRRDGRLPESWRTQTGTAP